MKIKYQNVDAVKTILQYNSFSGIYILLVLLTSIYLENTYSIGEFSWYFPITLLCGELVKSYYLRRNLKKQFPPKFNRKEFVKNIFLITVGVTLYDVLEVCAGAPVLDRQDQTISFAIILTILTVLPCCINLGSHTTIDLFMNIFHYDGDFVVKMILRTIHFTLLGAWLGAVVIPLDWDRPWQVWPVPCCLGALAGNILANSVNIILPNNNINSFERP